MRINLLLLMAVSFLPFPMKLMAEAINDTDAERAAVIFYGGSLLVVSVLVWALRGAVVRDRTLLRPRSARRRGSGDPARGDAEPGLLRRRDAPRDRRAARRRVRLPRDAVAMVLRARGVGAEAAAREPVSC